MNRDLTGSEIRAMFLRYFEGKGHTIVASSSLVPHNDPTLLFTNAGMVQFKDVFLGLEKKSYTRATTSQRCLRAGGKHNDLDTVGRTARHHTFFEMLGNFSFGDYFKRDAILYAWEFLTEVLELPKDKLYITVYEKDDEAKALWEELTDINPEHIFRIGEKDNFWSMGETGPCGPCSEIFVDRGELYGCGAEICGIGHCDCDRWMEIWNLVFMQYNRDEDGTLHPLPRPSIDTGMGLERVTSVIQSVDSNYDTDLMRGLIAEVETLSGVKYHTDEAGFPLRVIADHARSCSALIADGVVPSNEGRGYVLRRILRRAARLGRSIGLEKPFLYKLVPAVAASLGSAAPELAEKQETVGKIIRIEEERFNMTLQDGLNVAAQMIESVKRSGTGILKGADAFLLYDTYGFPLDLTKDIVEESGVGVDIDGFNAAMEEQRRRSKESRQKSGEYNDTANLVGLLTETPATEFLGYEHAESEARVLKIFTEDAAATEVFCGQEGYIVLDKTVFYAESGGQAGDTGFITANSGQLAVSATKKLVGGVYLHRFEVLSGTVKAGDTVTAAYDAAKRLDTARNHSATHLLQKALRDKLGEHLHQAGSLVTADRLRFDFSHFSALTAGEIAAVESAVNEQILLDLSISCREMPVDEAKNSGAMAIFGEKYGDVVRVVSMGEFSKELCGGIHCSSTGQIGAFKIISEGGIGAGIRRIEAVTGRGALNYYHEQEAILAEIAQLLKTGRQDTLKKIQLLQAELKQMQKDMEKQQGEKTKESVNAFLDNIVEIAGVKVLAQEVVAADMNSLRITMDMIREKFSGGIIALVSKSGDGDKVNIAVSVSENLRERMKEKSAVLHAGNLAKEMASICGGSGGGRPDMAQAGGKDPAKIKEALASVHDILRSKL